MADAPDSAAIGAPVVRSVARRRFSRTLRIVLALFVLLVFGLPQIAGVRRNAHQLSRVNPVLLVVGLALEFAALFAYSLLTRACLPKVAPRLSQLFRIQMSTKAINNVVPGGSAAGAALGYRLLTVAGVESADAGFALATAGVGSAVVLNLMLWVTLLISIPVAGFRPIYVTAALAGVLLLGAFGVVLYSLMRGQVAAERVVRAVARRVRWMHEDRMGQLVRRLAARLRELLADRELLTRVLLFALLNWLLDAAALWVFLRAFGETVRPDGLIVSFCIVNVLAAIPITPGGLGVVDTSLPALLVFFGAGSSAALLGVSSYRVAQFWLPIPIGAVLYLSLRFGPFAIDREHRLAGFRTEAERIVESGETIYDWADRFGHRVLTPPPGDADPDAGSEGDPPVVPPVT